MLLLAVCGVSSADANPNQMGDQGGARAAELDKQLRERNNGPMNQAPYVATPAQPAYVAPPSVASNPMPGGSFGSSGVSDFSGISSGNSFDPGAATSSVPAAGDNSGFPTSFINQDNGSLGQNGASPLGQPGSVVLIGPQGSTTNPADAAIQTLPALNQVSGGIQSLDWFGVGFDLINQHKSVQILDINTGVNWSATYINGKNHADIIPASAADAETIARNSITGSYVRRPVVVTINGTRYAGSMYAIGHGETSYCNYFKGVMCIHFTGSQTHGSKQVDTDHQTAINEALKYAN